MSTAPKSTIEIEKIDQGDIEDTSLVEYDWIIRINLFCHHRHIRLSKEEILKLHEALTLWRGFEEQKNKPNKKNQK